MSLCTALDNFWFCLFTAYGVDAITQRAILFGQAATI